MNILDEYYTEQNGEKGATLDNLCSFLYNIEQIMNAILYIRKGISIL